MNDNSTIREPISGSRTFFNFFITFIVLLGGLSFFLVGLSSYFNKQFFPFTDTSNISFIPQGIVMLFYGSLGCFISFYLLLFIIFDVGSGYNEFSKKDNLIRIVRKNFPGKNNLVFLTYSFDSVKKIKIISTQGLNSRNNILLVLRDQREIPLFSFQNFQSLTEIESEAIKIAKFLNVPLESNLQNYI